MCVLSFFCCFVLFILFFILGSDRIRLTHKREARIRVVVSHREPVLLNFHSVLHVSIQMSRRSLKDLSISRYLHELCTIVRSM